MTRQNDARAQLASEPNTAAVGKMPSVCLVVALCLACVWSAAEGQEDGCSSDDCYCSRRLRLENSSGVIVDHLGVENYKSQSHCLFYIETDRPMSSVRLRFNRFDLECLWDYLYIFTGDSIQSTKIAAFTGDLLPSSEPPSNDNDDITPIPMLDQNGTSPSNTTGSGFGPDNGDVLIPYQEPRNIVLESPRSSLLLYFLTDGGVEKTGFNISYWVNYSCPEDCMGRGNCSDEGVCECGESWRGESCQLPSCPNDCFVDSGHGECVDGVCQCVPQYIGVDCSISLSNPHWETVKYTTSGNLSSAELARAGHSVVTTSSNTAIVFGGYRFPTAMEDSEGGGSGSGESAESGEGGGGEGVKMVIAGPQLLLYDMLSGEWEELRVNESAPKPSPRYGHSAVLYNDTMHVFGGVLIPEEQITSAHWALHLPTLTWLPLTLVSNGNNDVIANSTSDNFTAVDVGNHGDVTVTMADDDVDVVQLPLPVRSHTAHMVATTMVVLFGMSDLQHALIYFVQEYDLVSGVWSVPSQNGVKPTGRMGHSSVYDEASGVVYVYGGQLGDRPTSELLAYDPLIHRWSRRESAPYPSFFHTAALLWGRLMLVFGGSGSAGDCFSQQLLIYNTECNEWFEADYLGLPGDGRRFGHASFVDQTNGGLTVFGGFIGVPLGDMVQLKTGDCSGYSSEGECGNSTLFCGWSQATNSCLSLADNTSTPFCSVDECLELRWCDECVDGGNCTWSEGDSVCRTGPPQVNITCPTASSSSTFSADNSTTDTETCAWFGGSCWGCLGRGCQWTSSGDCVDPSLNVTTGECTVPCSHTSCNECAADASNCLWCPSLNQCLSSHRTQFFAFTYPFGQCLGYVNQLSACPVSCDSHVTCGDCHMDPECGWCRDPADTGLGTCSPGGFLSPSSSSIFSDESCPDNHWFFEQCPACQCNGHSTCVNGSICEDCQNNTQGLDCGICANGYFGNAKGGGICSECNCNDYPSSCDPSTGDCTCYDVGVVGPSCSACAINNSYEGDADNICYYKMSIGFVYTFEVSDPRERESFYLTVPPDDLSLTFRFKIRENPMEQEVYVQLFLGRISEGLWVLANLSDPIRVTGEGSFTRELDDRSGSRNSSNPPLFSFTHPRLRNTSNFTEAFSGRREHDYTSRMWNGDVALVIRVTNLTNPMTFRITLDQTNLWFLLYFFATFIICFTGLLTAFMIGWYIKRKIDRRRHMRQLYRDLRRRVARPFSRIKIILHRRLGYKKTLPNKASYVSYQPCRSGKAAILTSFIHLPGDASDGRPAPGRTGLCLGTALVKLNDRSGKDRGSGGGGKRGRGRRKRGEGEIETEEIVDLQQQQQTREETNGTVGERVHEHTDSSSSPPDRPSQ